MIEFGYVESGWVCGAWRSWRIYILFDLGVILFRSVWAVLISTKTPTTSWPAEIN